MTKRHPTPPVPPLTLEQAHELIHKRLDRITELEDRLNQHSGNSSKPPSSDGPGTPAVCAQATGHQQEARCSTGSQGAAP
ncbi:DUF6444 domain-containing protein [Escherichia coli]|uniref:DUF6444 domain-containing protein n=1 Tax=Escherichia coli TaxID=562 RepID=UPI0023586A39|nr:DUF6444 domain-containing protein [Escherichia coli]MDC9046360.1 DUF6444 domain-containing protein [Escherichia coli]